MQVKELMCIECGHHFEAELDISDFCHRCQNRTLELVRHFDRFEDRMYDPREYVTLADAAQIIGVPVDLVQQRCARGLYLSRLDRDIAGNHIRLMRRSHADDYADGSVNRLMTFGEAIALVLRPGVNGLNAVRRPTWYGHAYLWYTASYDPLDRESLFGVTFDESELDADYSYPVLYSPGGEGADGSTIYRPTDEDRVAADWHEHHFG